MLYLFTKAFTLSPLSTVGVGFGLGVTFFVIAFGAAETVASGVALAVVVGVVIIIISDCKTTGLIKTNFLLLDTSKTDPARKTKMMAKNQYFTTEFYHCYRL